LTNLLKKSSGAYKWDEACNEAFERHFGESVGVEVAQI
jgi:hypothetical protein